MPLDATPDRLSIRPRGDGSLIDLVPHEPEGAAPLLTVPLAPDVVLLDALRVSLPDAPGVVYATEFSPISQRSRVCRYPLGGARPPRAEVIHVGEPGDVLWWLHVQDDLLSVREVRRGATIPLLRLPVAAQDTLPRQPLALGRAAGSLV